MNEWLAHIAHCKAGPGARKRRGLAALIAWLSIFIVWGHLACAQLVQVPFASNAAGFGPGSGATVCSSALDAVGDGCPATQASLSAAVQASWTDSYGNLYIADYTNFLLRVVYRGGSALSAIIKVNNPALTGNPQAGYIYAVAGPGSGSLTSPYYCNHSNGAKGLDAMGDGCPAYQAYSRANGGSVDAAGDIFYIDQSHAATAEVQVVYAGGTAAANLIQLESGVTAPVIGYVYRIGGPSNAAYGYNGDGGLAGSAAFNLPRSLIVDNNENIYIADTANNVVRRIDGTTGVVSAFAGGNGAGCAQGAIASCTAAYAGDNGPAASASLNAPYEVALDANGNLYIADSGNKRIRVVYAAGTLLGISNPVVGDIYTFAGGGSSTISGSTALNLSFTAPRGVSVDSSGSLYVMDYSANKIWRIDAATSIGTVYSGGGTAAVAGAYCNGSAGPAAADTLGDGCPATQAVLNGPTGRLAFDTNNVAYVADYANGLVRSFTFNAHFLDTQVGSTTSLPVAVTSYNSFTAPDIYAGIQGQVSSEFTGLATACAAKSSYAANTVCTYEVQFTPSLPGERAGYYQFAVNGITQVSAGIGGNGLASLISISAGGSTASASSVSSPQSISADELGNLYISDTTHGYLWKGAAGSNAYSTVATGLLQPWQSAIDGMGNIYIADSGNNRIVALSPSGVMTVLVTGLSGPRGVAALPSGILYIADTGHNRIVQYNNGAQTVLPITGLNGPSALSLDSSGTLYIADTENGQIVKYSLGIQSAVTLSSTSFTGPIGLAIDPAGDIYFADSLGSTLWELASGSTAPVALLTGLNGLGGIALDSTGNLFYANSASSGIAEVGSSLLTLSFANTNTGLISAPSSFSVINIGNQPLVFTNSQAYQETGNTLDFTVLSSYNTCAGVTIAAGASCYLSVAFTPTATGSRAATLTFPSGAVNVVVAALMGTASASSAKMTTTTTLSPVSSSVVYGNALTIYAAVASSTNNSAGNPTGTVNLNLTNSGSNGVISGTASSGPVSSLTGTLIKACSMFTLTSLQVNSYSFSANYLGDSNYYASTTTSSISASITQASLTAVASNISRVFGAANSLGYTLSGLVNGDTASTIVTGTPALATTAVRTAPTGTYPVTIAAGTLALTASGSIDYSTPAYSNGTLTVTGGAVQSIAFAGLPNFSVGSTALLTAQASSGLPVVYTVSGPATISGSALTVTAAGTVTVTATQSGNSNYGAAAPVARSFIAQ